MECNKYLLIKGLIMKWEKEKEVLERLINKENVSYEEIGRRYGISGQAIKKAARKLGIILPQRRKVNENEVFNHKKKTIHKCLNCGKEFEHRCGSYNKYCTIKCQAEHKHKKCYKLIINGDESIMRGNYSPKKFKDFIMDEQNNKCAICGCEPEHNGKPLVFVLDHIDGNAANNKRDNLRCICPNCDSQLDTYKSKNKNGARSYYRYHKFDDDTKIGK